MKKLFFVMMTLVTVSCSEQLTMEDMTEIVPAQIPGSNVDSLIAPEIMRHNDPLLETAITNILQEDVGEYRKWLTATIYVVETGTGKIKASVGLKRSGQNFVPHIDAYDEEQTVMECGSTYLALLSSERVTPEQVFDTGYGIYEDIHGNLVKDHNWRRGGYQQISLERGLEVHSEIAFTIAKEYVYGSNTSEFDGKISTFLAGSPNNAMGILTFYNAIANNGRMMELVSEGKAGVVLHEEIAQPQYVKQLQTGLEQCVSKGLMRKAGRDYVKVSAYGRRIELNKKDWRLELYGYFPSDNPIYTIMVIIEKSYLPASTGGICGPIFAHIVDVLVDLYNLQPLLVRQNEDVDEVIEAVDTVAVAN